MEAGGGAHPEDYSDAAAFLQQRIAARSADGAEGGSMVRGPVCPYKSLPAPHTKHCRGLWQGFHRKITAGTRSHTAHSHCSLMCQAEYAERMRAQKAAGVYSDESLS